jgi:broad specificity phosphatase PhoE
MTTSGPCRVFLASPGSGAAEAAARLAAALESVVIDAVYCADPADLRATLDAFLTQSDAKVVVDPRLRDGDDAGGESVANALERALPAFCELASAHQGGTVLLVGNTQLVQGLLSHVTRAGVRNALRFAGGALTRTIVEVAADGHGVLRALNANTAARGTPQDGNTRVIMIRHGHAMSVEKGAPVYSHNPIPLSARGREQAARIAVALRTVHVDAIYSSDLVRARQTAEFCAQELGLEVIVDEALRELAIGDFEGMTLERVHAAHSSFVPWLEVTFRDRFPTADYHHPADLRFPNGQSVLDVHARSLAGFLRIVRAERGRTVVLVSHGWVLQPLLCHIVGADPREYFRFSLPTATLALAHVGDDGRGVLEIFNGGVGLEELPKLASAGARPG